RDELVAAVGERRRRPKGRHRPLQVDVDAPQQPALPEDQHPRAHRHQEEQRGDAARDGVALLPELREAAADHRPPARPSTSSMPNRPDVLPSTKRAARRLPSAYVARLDERCVISIRSPLPAKSTVWSPTMSPPRSDAKPIDPARRSPLWSYAATPSSDLPCAAATTSPICSAVPLGASTFMRWCVSTISTSNPSASARPATSRSLSTTLTPTLMLGASTIAMCSACAEIAAEREVRERALGSGEVDQHLARGERCARVAGDDDAARPAEKRGRIA